MAAEVHGYLVAMVATAARTRAQFGRRARAHESSGDLAALRSGSEVAWAELYRRLAPAVLGYARARGAPDPEEVTAEVFTQVVRDLPTFQGEGASFRSWVFTIAHHRVLDAARSARRRPVEHLPADELERLGTQGPAPDGAAAVIDRAQITRLLSVLSPDQRTVLLLRLVADLTIEEIAVVMNKRAGAVKALQRRGLEALRAEVQPDA